MCNSVCKTLCQCGILVLTLTAMPMTAAHGQNRMPVKQGLWESQINTTMKMDLPPEMEARIAAMPPERQAQVRAMMGGSKPLSNTSRSCLAKSTSVDNLLNEAQQKNGMKCTFTNRTENSNSTSFDTSCVSPQGTVSGHTEVRMEDENHATATSHMTANFTAPSGGSTHMTVESKMSSKYLGSDCGDVKPNSAVTR